MSEDWDVIIIGAGSAGIPAAIFAANRGATVLQIEADDKIGGTLMLSSGQISAAGTILLASSSCASLPCNIRCDIPTGRPVQRHGPSSRYIASNIAREVSARR